MSGKNLVRPAKPDSPKLVLPPCVIRSLPTDLQLHQSTELKSSHSGNRKTETSSAIYFLGGPPPVLSTAPSGEQNHGDTPGHNGCTCWSVWGVWPSSCTAHGEAGVLTQEYLSPVSGVGIP